MDFHKHIKVYNSVFAFTRLVNDTATEQWPDCLSSAAQARVLPVYIILVVTTFRKKYKMKRRRCGLVVRVSG
jgi:predicted alternative tryptophan synthase beta-subunit